MASGPAADKAGPPVAPAVPADGAEAGEDEGALPDEDEAAEKGEAAVKGGEEPGKEPMPNV